MRILHLADRLGERGGAYRSLLAVARAQASTHDVRLAVGRIDPGAEAPCPVTVVPGLDARTAEPVALDELRDAQDADLLHVHTVVNPVALEWAAARGAVITVQDHRYFCPGRGRWTADGRVCRESPGPGTCAPCFTDPVYFDDVLGLTAARLAAVRAMDVVVLSEYMRGELVAAGVAADRVQVIPPFVDVAPPATSGPREHVLFVGRLVEAKGPGDAVAAWRRSGVRLPLVVAGAGPLRDALGEAGARVAGWRPYHEMADLYRRAAAVLLPSRWQEPFGIAGLEALAHGAPVVAWDSGGVREWHPGPLGAWGDVDALAARLAEVVRDPPTVPPLPDRFTRAHALDALERVYSGRLTRGRASPAPAPMDAPPARPGPGRGGRAATRG